MLNIGNHLTDKLFNGDLYDGNTFVDRASVNAEPFVDRFENQMAGWAFTFDLVTRNNIDRCNLELTQVLQKFGKYGIQQARNPFSERRKGKGLYIAAWVMVYTQPKQTQSWHLKQLATLNLLTKV
ncbi:MAG: hypothetical protein CM15mV90_050 [uncultured marine virus]|nr:MAG: hypothetical protein CM15mV90_050 [uncultured marine virus]